MKPELRPLIHAALNKRPDSPAVAPLITWLKRQAAKAITDPSSTLPCTIPMAFYDDATIVEGIIHGKFEAELLVWDRTAPEQGAVSPWRMLCSIVAGNHHGTPRIPNEGFTASDVVQLVPNTMFLFNLISRDPTHYRLLRPHHGTFSRFSFLGGQLRYLERVFEPSGYQQDWNNQTIPWRHKRTVGLCYLYAELFEIMSSWSDNAAPAEFFLQARQYSGSLTDLTLLNTQGLDDTWLHDKGQAWRDKVVKYFSRSKLREPPPSDGPFCHGIPPFLVPPAVPPPDTSTNFFASHRNERARDRREGRRAREAERAARTAAPAPAPTPAPSSRRGGRLQRPQIQGTNIARYCLLAPVPGVARKELQHIISQIPRSDRNRPQVPKIDHPGSEFHNKSLCFEYCSADTGCSHGTHCNYAHCDMNEPNTQQLPMSFFQSVQRLVHHEAVRPYWSPTSHLTNKLTSS